MAEVIREWRSPKTDRGIIDLRGIASADIEIHVHDSAATIGDGLATPQLVIKIGHDYRPSFPSPTPRKISPRMKIRITSGFERISWIFCRVHSFSAAWPAGVFLATSTARCPTERSMSLATSETTFPNE